MSIENFDKIVQHELQVRRRESLYLAVFLLAIGIVIAAIMNL